MLIACSLIPVPSSLLAAETGTVPVPGGEVTYTNAAAVKTLDDKSVLLTFSNSTEAASFTLSDLTSVRILAIGGGGGGGGGDWDLDIGTLYGGGAGGGAGGFVETNALYSAATYVVSVGAGGVGGKFNGAADHAGTSGEPTTIMTNGVDVIRVLGGGGGGGNGNGGNGGSGGGGSMIGPGGSNGTAGSAKDGQGFAGGAGDKALMGAGGGGASKAGGAASTGGKGGDGRQSDITLAANTPKADWPWYAGGGGGGDVNYESSAAAAAGGQGGGGAGGVGENKMPINGVDGLGGGGGGCRYDSAGARGGSGVVYVRVIGSFDGEKPKDSQVEFDGKEHYPITPSDFLEIEGDNDPVSAVGVYTARAKPKNDLKWSDGSSDWVSVTMVIYEKGLISGTAEVTGETVAFAGAFSTNWVENADGGLDFLIGFSNRVATFTLPDSTKAMARILAIGGGGGGGGGDWDLDIGTLYGGGGGGGAGGFVETNALYSAATYVVSVGAGGVGGKFNGAADHAGTSGEPTTIMTNGVDVIRALGGGGGGGNGKGGDGGSGGGGSMIGPDGEAGLAGKGTSGQGCAGGAGDKALMGAGGGGASKAGGAASTGGKGGDGRQSDITLAANTPKADWPWYAGGGGGGDVNYESSAAAAAGGQGGGGAGGVGENKMPINGVDGLGGGGGGCRYDSAGARGGSGIVWVRISMVGEVEKPVSTEVVYDREEHHAIKPSVFYDITGDNVGTNVGTYTATATLKPGGKWPDGTDGPATVTMTITKRPVTVTDLRIDSWTYGDKTIPEPTCSVDPEWAPLVYEWRVKVEGEGEQWKDWSSEKPVHAGAYELRVRLPDEENYEFTASVDPIGFTIRKVTVTYSNLKQLNWMYGTPAEDVPKPTCTVDPSWVGKVFEYEGTGEEGAWSTNLPVTVGIHRVRVLPPDFNDYELSPDSAQPVEFQIIKGLGNIFTDYVDIRIAPYTGTEPPPPLKNFPYRLEISETDPVGFLYERVGDEGKEMTFTDASGDNILPYVVDRWVTNDVSVVYVRLPELAATEQTIRLYWHLRPNAEPPAYTPQLVWSDWKKTQADKVAIPPRTFPDPVSRDGKFVSYWLKMPAMSRTFWDTNDPAYDPADPDHTKGEITTNAVAAGVATKRTIRNSVTGEPYDEIADIPEDVGGAFRVTWELDDEAGAYWPLETHIDFAIASHTPWEDLKGGAKTLTLSGRAMLANDDWLGADSPDGANAVAGQAYWRTRTVDIGGGQILTNDIYWVHGGEEHGKFLDNTGINHMLPGTEHRLKYWEDGTEKTLWRFGDVIIGSVMPDTLRPTTEECVLPWSSTAFGISSYAKKDVKGDPLEAGNLILRNKKSAVIYSPCYTNGIGTIYFDAVNAANTASQFDFMHLVVEVATETKEGKIPTDENAEDTSGTGLDRDLGKITAKQWIPQTMIAFYRDGTAGTFKLDSVTNELPLTCDVRRSTNNFYRVVVQLNERKACRFRIRRTSANEAPGYTADNNTLILVDNILVSYPSIGAEVTPYGLYDKAKVRKQILGQENALIPPFPSVKDKEVFGRGKVVPYVNAFTNVAPEGLVTLAKMHYRWRYLDQASNAWYTVDLSPGDDFTTQAALSLTNREGDVEFWYECCVNAPYYQYVDYSGTDVGMGGLYSEEHSTVTNGFENPWFVRLRPGKSDTEAFRLYVKTAAEAEPEIVEMSLVGNHMWRGLYQTIDPVGGGDGRGLFVRFEALNRQIAGSKSFATNVTYYALHGDVTDLKEPTSLEPMPDSNRWSRVVCDARTGHLLFQLSETTMGATIVHADYQDFNKWNDANVRVGEKPVFVGTSTDTNAFNMSGTAATTREYTEDFGWWRYSLATNQYWSEPFEEKPEGDYEPWKPFSEAESPNGFTVGPGQWATAAYRDTASGLALQMEGRGKGYIQFVNAAQAPRGLESISFGARIGQAIEFGDFTHFADARITELTNYTFFCRGTYDTNQRRDFSGNASLSLVAFYNAGEGCYELRVEQENAVMLAGKVTGAGNKQRLSLYRWNYDEESGELVPTLLGGKSDVFESSTMLTTSGELGNYSLLFISAENTKTETRICAGVSTGVGPIATVSGKTSCRWVSFIDDDADKRLRNGFYGVLSANCPARFRNLNQGYKAQTPTTTSKHTFHAKTQDFNFPSSSGFVSCWDSFRNGGWVIRKNRLGKIDENNSDMFGFGAKAVTQPLKVLVGPAGSTKASEYREILTTNLTNYSSAEPIVLKLWTLDECSVKIAAGGTAGSARNDIVIDDIELRQWRGESYDGKEGQKYFDDIRYGSPTNFVFTQAWITHDIDSGEKVCRLSAKRSKTEEPTSIRTPLMDGEGGRGKGLGMISFGYANAQTNVNLLVQVATNNVTRGLFADITASTVDETEWTTVTNFSFAGATPKELVGGVRSVYLGLHDVVGAMRIVMDPKVVESVVAVSNEEVRAFGEIDITGVLCRDEPKLDGSSWWGWNIRTSDEDSRRYLWDETPTGLNRGMSFALNNSISSNVLERDIELYPRHLPFLQTPTFDAEAIGEIAFQARKYAATDPDTRIVLFGSRIGEAATDKDWQKVTEWTIADTLFTLCTYKTRPGEGFCAFRLAVTGVAGVDEDGKMPDPKAPTDPLRVLIDEVTVMDAIRARVAFRNVAAFRSHLDTQRALDLSTEAKRKAEQPLCHESFGVQAEIYAAQLAEEVDLSNARVYLWWHAGESPWGFANWTNTARRAELGACEGTNLVFRSSHPGAPEAIVDPQEKPGVVQYMLEVVYDSEGVEVSDWLEPTDWDRPSWYEPIDLNADHVAEGFSAYTILDEVAPGYAWINEVNMYDGPSEALDVSGTNQYIEIAVPTEANIVGWKLRLVGGGVGDEAPFVTNTIATFGSGDVPSKKSLGGAQNYVFITVGNPYSCTLATRKAGTIDGTWSFDGAAPCEQQMTDGRIACGYPVGIQLVRPSGIIEQQLVAAGTNTYAGIPYYGEILSPTNWTRKLQERYPGSGWFFAGEDLGANKCNSLSATNQFAAEGMWTHEAKTPGRINGGEWIDPDHPTPQGSSIILYANLEGGHLSQSTGAFVDATENLVLYVQKGNPAGTDIVYRVSKWYEMDSITENGVPRPGYAGRGADGEPVVFTAAVNASNNVTVTARARMDSRLMDYGLGPDNAYTEAILKWLTDGTTLRRDADGNLIPFAHPEGDIALAEHYDLKDSFVETLDLTTMYWLDMDPTISNLVLKADVCGIHPPVEPKGQVGVDVLMVISNKADAAYAPYAPYTLRGLEPDDSSADYDGVWKAETFRVTGRLLTMPDEVKSYVSLKGFVFGPRSFKAAGEPDEFTSHIKVDYPFAPPSPGFNEGWGKYEGKTCVGYGWTIGADEKPLAPQVLVTE